MKFSLSSPRHSYEGSDDEWSDDIFPSSSKHSYVWSDDEWSDDVLWSGLLPSTPKMFESDIKVHYFLKFF